jgi:hypothetical protein
MRPGCLPFDLRESYRLTPNPASSIGDRAALLLTVGGATPRAGRTCPPTCRGALPEPRLPLARSHGSIDGVEATLIALGRIDSMEPDALPMDLDGVAVDDCGDADGFAVRIRREAPGRDSKNQQGEDRHSSKSAPLHRHPLPRMMNNSESAMS